MEYNKTAKSLVEEYTSSYAAYVATSRAIPDVVDGLKPVQRRCINSAKDLTLFHNKPFLKVAKLEGQVLGDYHPHGGASPVLLAQPFNIRYPIFEGQGNFGSPDNPVPAASRYIECRLSEFAERFYLESANYADVEDNYDGRLKEIVRYYPPIPGSLLTSASGIAVGLSTEIPPHRIADVCTSLLSYIKNPNSDDFYELLPDTCEESIIVSSKEDIKSLYKSGEGSIRYRAKFHYESIEGKLALVVDAFPPNYRKKSLETSYILDQVDSGKLELRNESKEGIRYVFLSTDIEILKKVEERLESSVGYRLYMDNKGVIKCYTLKELYKDFIEARLVYLERKYKSLLESTQREYLYLDTLLKIKLEKDFIKSLLDMTSKEAIDLICTKYGVTDDIASKVIHATLTSLMKDNIEIIKSKLGILSDNIKEYQHFIDNPLDKLVSDIKELYKLYKNENKRAIHVDEVDSNINIKYQGRTISAHPSDMFYVATKYNQYYIQNATELLQDEYLESKYVVSTDYEYYIFYDSHGLIAVTKDTMGRLNNKFKSKSLSGVVGVNNLEDVSILKSDSSREVVLGDWAIRSRSSYIRVTDDGEISLTIKV